ATRLALNPAHELAGYLRLWPFLFVFLATYAGLGLYSVVALSPPEELRNATVSSTLLFLVLAASTVSMRGARTPYTPILFLAIVCSAMFVPILRATVRRCFARLSWWGCPAVLFGTSEGVTVV